MSKLVVKNGVIPKMPLIATKNARYDYNYKDVFDGVPDLNIARFGDLRGPIKWYPVPDYRYYIFGTFGSDGVLRSWWVGELSTRVEIDDGNGGVGDTRLRLASTFTPVKICGDIDYPDTPYTIYSNTSTAGGVYHYKNLISAEINGYSGIAGEASMAYENDTPVYIFKRAVDRDILMDYEFTYWGEERREVSSSDITSSRYPTPYNIWGNYCMCPILTEVDPEQIAHKISELAVEFV